MTILLKTLSHCFLKVIVEPYLGTTRVLIDLPFISNRPK